MSEELGQIPTNKLIERIRKLERFEAHVSDLAYSELQSLKRELNYRKTQTNIRTKLCP